MLDTAYFVATHSTWMKDSTASVSQHTQMHSVCLKVISSQFNLLH